MVVEDIKPIVKGSADLEGVRSGGIAVYKLTSEDNHTYVLEIDTSDKHDVGETAEFLNHYNKALILMRWIRRANENDTLIKLS